MRILHLVTSLNPGGIERWVLQMLEAFQNTDIHMDVCCKGEPGLWATRAQKLGAKVLTCRLDLTHVRFATKLSRILRRGEYDLLHCHLGIYGAFPVWIAHRMGIPVVNTFHSNEFASHHAWFRNPFARRIRSVYGRFSISYAIKKSDFIVGVSQGVIDALNSKALTKTKGLAVIHHGVKIPTLGDIDGRNRFRENLGWRKEDLLILHVGRFDEQKNQKDCITTFHKIANEVPEARLIFVGDGWLRVRTEAMVRSMGLSDRVQFLGIRDNVEDIMTWSDLFVFPSLHEGFGIVAIEAAAAGLPIVAYDIPPLTEIVQDGKTGILCPLHDVSSMALSIKSLLKDRDLRVAMGTAGRRMASENFSVAAMADSYLNVYESVLEAW